MLFGSYINHLTISCDSSRDIDDYFELPFNLNTFQIITDQRNYDGNICLKSVRQRDACLCDLGARTLQTRSWPSPLYTGLVSEGERDCFISPSFGISQFLYQYQCYISQHSFKHFRYHAPCTLWYIKLYPCLVSKFHKWSFRLVDLGWNMSLWTISTSLGGHKEPSVSLKFSWTQSYAEIVISGNSLFPRSRVWWDCLLYHLRINTMCRKSAAEAYTATCRKLTYGNGIGWVHRVLKLKFETDKYISGIIHTVHTLSCFSLVWYQPIAPISLKVTSLVWC